MAQRVMDLGDHGQILMHDRVRGDLEGYPEFTGRLRFAGDFTVKHGMVLPVAQYVDPANPNISATPVRPPVASERTTFAMDDIISRRVKGKVLSLQLTEDCCGDLQEVFDFVEDYLDANGAFQRLKIAAGLIASELIANACQHADLQGERFELKIDSAGDGLMLWLIQPDHTAFNLHAVLRDPAHAHSFMQMMQNRGLHWLQRRADGKLEIGLFLPADLNQDVLGPAIAFDVPIAAPRAPANVHLAFSRAWTVSEDALIYRTQGRIDETNWEVFAQQIIDSVKQVAEAKAKLLVIDLVYIDYMSSRGHRALTIARRSADNRRVALALARPNGRMRRSWRYPGMTRSFGCWMR